MKDIADESVQLIITDPPHSDRVPYLELSEFWNAILGEAPEFKNELVISNAKERSKTSEAYADDIQTFFAAALRVLKRNGYLVVLFNSRTGDRWLGFDAFFQRNNDTSRLAFNYVGHFPCNYSANSVVQDNRRGSLKTDYALVFTRTDGPNDNKSLAALRRLPGWSEELPKTFVG